MEKNLSDYILSQEFVINGQRRVSRTTFEAYNWHKHKDLIIDVSTFFKIHSIFHDKVFIELDSGELLLTNPKNVIDQFNITCEVKDLTKSRA